MANENGKNVKRSRDKRSGGGGKAAAAVVLAALLLGGGGYYGISGNGMGFLPDHAGIIEEDTQASKQNESDTEKTEETEATTTEEKQEEAISIVVKEGTVLYQGSEIKTTAFEETLLKDYREGIKITLKDDHAVKATYDEIKAVLDRLGYTYTEE